MAKKSALILCMAVAFLLVVGMVMLTSVCIYVADAPEGDPYQEVKQQGIWLGLSLVVCFVAASIDYRHWQKYVWWAYGAVVLMLILCFVPHVGREINGEYRWISGELVGLSGTTVQPSEFAKLMLVLLLAYWYSRHPDSGDKVIRGMVVPMAMAGLLIMLVFVEVDLGTTSVLVGVCLALMFLARVHWGFLTGISGAGAAGAALILSLDPGRMERIFAFLDPEKHRLGAYWQNYIGLMALGSGGMEGLGWGEGRMKMEYLPFAETDFIFPMVGEELGLPFTLGVIYAFLAIVVMGIFIGNRAPDRFGMFLATGIAAIFGFQAAVNIAVTIGAMPNTGLPLPFVSKGGSSLIVSMFAIGVLLNVYRQGRTTTVSDWSWRGKKKSPALTTRL